VADFGSRSGAVTRPARPARLGYAGLVEVAYLCRRGRAAEPGHPLVPSPVARHGQSLDVIELLEVDLDVVTLP
jgi:hypothetical protein